MLRSSLLASVLQPLAGLCRGTTRAALAYRSLTAVTITAETSSHPSSKQASTEALQHCTCSARLRRDTACTSTAPARRTKKEMADNNFDANVNKRICEHMNQDHAASVLAMAMALDPTACLLYTSPSPRD